MSAVKRAFPRSPRVLIWSLLAIQAVVHAAEPPRQAPSNAYIAPTGLHAGRPNVAVIVHGYTADPTIWASDFAASYANRLGITGGAGDWDIWVLDWRFGAREMGVYPQTENEVNAQLQGQFVARTLAAMGYQHIHLMGHSLGGRVIESAATILDQQTSAKIHQTFFDAYTPYNWSSVYGERSDWSEHYYDTDDTSLTNAQMPHALNANVTAYRTPTPTDYLPGYAFRDASWAHNSPHRWYKDTIDVVDEEPPHDHHYGFRLSKGGTTQWPRAGYDVGTNVVLSPTTSAAVVSTSPVPPAALQAANNKAVDLTAVDALFDKSNTGIDGIHNGMLQLDALHQDPGWANVRFRIDRPVNFIQFDYRFPMADEGLLEVMLNGHFLWAAEAAFASDAFLSTGKLVWTGTDFLRNPNTAPLAAGTYTLSFRLDTTSDLGAFVDIRNITGGLIVPEPATIALLLAALWIGGRRRGAGPAGARGCYASLS